jgi:hypothetical protein
MEEMRGDMEETLGSFAMKRKASVQDKVIDLINRGDFRANSGGSAGMMPTNYMNEQNCMIRAGMKRGNTQVLELESLCCHSGARAAYSDIFCIRRAHTYIYIVRNILCSGREYWNHCTTFFTPAQQPSLLTICYHVLTPGSKEFDIRHSLRSPY